MTRTAARLTRECLTLQESLRDTVEAKRAALQSFQADLDGRIQKCRDLLASDPEPAGRPVPAWPAAGGPPRSAGRRYGACVPVSQAVEEQAARRPALPLAARLAAVLVTGLLAGYDAAAAAAAAWPI